MTNAASTAAAAAQQQQQQHVACKGCGAATTTAFQCPLCQAEAATDRGYFCTQECFASNWLEHRNTLHKSGVVREKKRAAPTTESTTDASATAKASRKSRATKRSRAEEEGEQAESETAAAVAVTVDAGVHAPWPALPNAAACVAAKMAQITPALPLNAPRAVVRAGGDAQKQSVQDCMWSALLAAAQYVASSVQVAASAAASRSPSDAASSPSSSSTADVAPMQVLVVAGDVYSAHAFAWAARCMGLSGMLQLAVSEAASTADAAEEVDGASHGAAAATATASLATPSRYFSAQKRVVIATAAVVRASAMAQSAAATAVSGAVALWLTGSPAQSLLVTLPDVADAADLQGVQTRAVFFTDAAGLPGNDDPEDTASTSAPAYTYSAAAVTCEDGLLLRWAPVAVTAPGSNSTTAAASLDDDVCTCFANGDLAGALHQLVRCYQHQPGHLEANLFYTLCCNWGAASLAHAHHRLAYVARYLCDHAARFEARKNATLADAALRAIAAVVRLLPRMRDVEAEEAAAAAAAAAASTATGGAAEAAAGAAKSKRRKTSKSEAAVAAALDASYVPSLASTTRPAPAVEGEVSAPSALEVARYANYFTYLPNLQLQATVCYLYPVASPAVLDTLAVAWGLYRYLPGPSSLETADSARRAAVLRLRQRLTAKLDAANGVFYAVLMHFVYDAVGSYSLSVEEVRRRLQWDLTLGHDAGPLEAYLRSCGLLVADDGLLLPTSHKQRVRKVGGDGAGAAAAALSSRLKGSRETTRARTERLRGLAVKAAMTGNAAAAAGASAAAYGVVELPWRSFPITGERQRQVARLHQAAVEEVLMAMPRVPRPMYIGDVGNLIGKWMHFNSRFEGTLGVNLQAFLEQHPEAFKVLDNIVTRRTAGTTEQVRIRFDGDDDERGEVDSDDENGRSRKARDRQLLTGQKRGKDGKKIPVELPARARKKRAVKEFNKERFNRNYKSIDPSARVPGYIKRGPRRIKGRGKKANKRVVKRGS